VYQRGNQNYIDIDPEFSQYHYVQTWGTFPEWACKYCAVFPKVHIVRQEAQCKYDNKLLHHCFRMLANSRTQSDFLVMKMKMANKLNIGGGSGVWLTDSFVKIGKW